ncbi:MAG: hypothetical protein COW65_19100 [Cytophagales bacterium CG18_big_fil_WC_8_21_14_2_50_42_9]|nr:MAG: hypothetical protein COW65_19100 [Cytophagales bacterium CG18_big_fil_WC_8_21_14_2_50_42_9]
MITKDKLLASIQDLPEEFSIDELIERLIVIQKIETGQKQAREGRTNTTEDAKYKLRKWLQ